MPSNMDWKISTHHSSGIGRIISIFTPIGVSANYLLRFRLLRFKLTGLIHTLTQHWADPETIYNWNIATCHDRVGRGRGWCRLHLCEDRIRNSISLHRKRFSILWPPWRFQFDWSRAIWIISHIHSLFNAPELLI